MDNDLWIKLRNGAYVDTGSSNVFDDGKVKSEIEKSEWLNNYNYNEREQFNFCSLFLFIRLSRMFY